MAVNPKKKKPNNETIAFALPIEWLTVIRRDAGTQERSVSFVLRKIIKKYYKFI